MLTGRNEFASGGLLLMIIGTISVWLRAVPERVWDWIVGQTTMMITVKDDDAAFAWVKEWFLEQRFLKRVRRVDLDTTVRNERIARFRRLEGTGSGMAADLLKCGFPALRTRGASSR